ncbi:DMT family transporter [Roseovarius sp. CAU 1744]|uniref:DMT family transporter n=1 Tax=Roseovarius sp. CAU 1744 TaxID=3140368 RepID=UPI00325AEB7E
MAARGEHNSGGGRAGMAALVLLLLMGLMWGLQAAMLKLAARSGLGDLTVLIYALLLLSVAFLAISALRGELYRPRAGVIWFLLVTAVIGYVIPLLAALYAASELSAGLLAIIGSMAPVVAVTVALFFRVERVSPRRLAAVVLGVVSIAIILLPEADLPGYGMLIWMLAALVVPLCYGAESVYIARFWPAGLSPLQVVTGETVMAALLVAPVFLWQGTALPAGAATGDAVIAIAVFALAGVIESLIYFHLIRVTGAVFVNFATFVSLFAGIGWGIVLFGESHAAMIWLAVLVLAGALYLAVREGPGSHA